MREQHLKKGTGGLRCHSLKEAGELRWTAGPKKVSLFQKVAVANCVEFRRRRLGRRREREGWKIEVWGRELSCWCFVLFQASVT